MSLINLNVWLELALGGVTLMGTYFVMVLVTKALTRRNVADIYSIVRKRENLRPIVDPLFAAMNRLTRD